MNYKKYQHILIKYFSEETWKDIIQRWEESHRYYHNIDHLNHILEQFQILYDIESITKKVFNKLIIVSFFHDGIYIPGAKDNEENF